MSIRSVLLAALVLLIPVLPAAAGPSLAELEFMTGVWRAESNGNVLEEHFTAPRDGTVVGMFRWTGEGATGFTEHIVIEDREDGVHLFLRHFHPGSVPWDQERDGAMHYRLSEVAGGRAVFEDPERLFPTRIVYHRTKPDTLVARLEGRDESGEDRLMEFTFRSIAMTTTATKALTDAGQSIGYNGGLTLALPVKDLDKSIRFYEDVVGFKLTYRMDDMGWCELSTSVPQVNLGLSQVEDPMPNPRTTPTFGVVDIDRARQVLEEHGAKFDGETVVLPGMVKLATFFDPDGNPIKLYESLSDELR